MMKKMISLIFVTTALLIMVSQSVFALEIGNSETNWSKSWDKTTTIIEKSDEEALAELMQKSQKDIAEEMGKIRSHPEEHDVVHFPVETKTVVGFAGGQLPGGYNFPSGGSLFFNDNGGPGIPITVALSGPYGVLSLSVTLGEKSGAGTIVNIPADTHFYRVEVTKVVKVSPYVIRKRAPITGEWMVISKGASQVTQNYSGRPIRVN